MKLEYILASIVSLLLVGPILYYAYQISRTFDEIIEQEKLINKLENFIRKYGV